MKRRSKSTSTPSQEYSINGTSTKISKFRVPRGDDVFLTIHSILNRELNDAVRTAQHVEAIYTLVYGSGSKHFDDAITGILLDVDYVVSGYPRDLLVHDTPRIRGAEPDKLIFCKSVLSSYCSFPGHHDITNDPSYDLNAYNVTLCA